MLLSFRHDRKELLHKEERRPDVDCKRPVEILDRGFFDGRRFRDPRIGDQNVEAISDNAAGLPGKLVSTIRGGKVRGYGIRAATTG
jgi:hypothetical protein